MHRKYETTYALIVTQHAIHKQYDILNKRYTSILRSLSLDGGYHIREARQPAVSLVLTHSSRQPAASSTDCDPDRLASMISLC